MYIEKYKLLAIKHKQEKLSDIIKRDNNYNNNYGYNSINLNINFELELVKDWKNDFELVEEYIFDTKKDAINTLESIRYDYNDVQHWSILPILVDVPVTELRKLKIDNIKESPN